jgi:hypothetical protein
VIIYACSSHMEKALKTRKKKCGTKFFICFFSYKKVL